jgi:Tfp pilus assembly protein PilF
MTHQRRHNIININQILFTLLYLLLLIGCSNRLTKEERQAIYKAQVLYQMNSGNYNRAMEISNNALIDIPNIQDVLLMRSRLYLMTLTKDNIGQNIRHALTDCNKVIEINGSNADAYKTRAFLYSFLKKDSDAIKDYNMAVSLNENDESLYHYRADFLCDRQQYDEAIKDYDKAISLADRNDPNTPDIIFARGKCNAKNSKNLSAIQDYTQAIKMKQVVLENEEECIKKGITQVADFFCDGSLKGTKDDLYRMLQERAKIYQSIKKIDMYKRDIKSAEKFKNSGT